MSDDDELKQAHVYIEEGNPNKALELVHRALMKHEGGAEVLRTIDSKVLKRPPILPELLSLYGLCIAFAEDRVQKGTMLCKIAVEMDISQPELYVNLGRVYLQAGQKSRAIQTFRKGLSKTGRNNELEQELTKLGVRARQPIPFLPRSNFLNKYIGLYLYRRKRAKALKKLKNERFQKKGKS